MHVNSGTALVAVALLAGCPGSQSVVCENGAICPEGTACTEDGRTLCGQPLEVEACVTTADYTPCSYDGLPDGVCRAGICVQCDENKTGCRLPDWRSMSSPTGADLKAIWAARQGAAYVVGDNGTALYYDGFEWSPLIDLMTEVAKEPAPTPNLISIWGVDEPRELFVVTDAKNVLFHYRDGVWSKAVLSTVYPLATIGGSSRTNVYVAGLLGEIWKYDGTTWSRFAEGQTTAQITSLWVSDSHVIATGNAAQATILHFEGSAFSELYTAPMNDTRTLDAVWASSPSDIFAVGVPPSTAMTPVVRLMPSPISDSLPSSDLNAVWGFSSTAVFAAGIGGDVFLFSGTWSERMNTPSRQTEIYGLGGTDVDVFAVGQGGAIWRYTR